MSQVNTVIQDLVTANHILAYEEIVDSYGHVSVRNPDNPSHFFLSTSVSPEQVSYDDIIEYDLNGEPVTDITRAQYSERYIHAAAYRDRADVNAVVHAHTESVLPFTVSTVRLRPLLHVAGIIGKDIPVWDMKDDFGETDLLVINNQHAESLIKSLGSHRVVLMRGHGYTAVAESLELAVRVSIYLKINARAQLAAMAIGPVNFLSDAEIDAVNAQMGSPKATTRVWDNWANRSATVTRGGEPS